MSTPYLLPLPGLREDNPRDFLAALGLLYCLNRCFPATPSSLAWPALEGAATVSMPSQISESWSVQICAWVKHQFSKDDLESELRESLHDQLAIEYASTIFGSLRREIRINRLVFAPTAKISPEVRRRLFIATRKIQETDPADPTIDLHAALMSQVQNEDPDSKKRVFSSISSLSMANKQGQKYLLFGAQQIALKHLDPASLKASIDGTGVKISEAPNLRLSHEEGRDAAYFGAVPEFSDYPAFNILAFFGLSFYPVIERLDVAVTSGFLKESFRWPSWDRPLTEEVLKTLLAHHAIFSPKLDPKALAALGVCQVWESRRYEANKSLFFARAKPCY